MRGVEIRPVVPDEWQQLRDVRLRALADAPTAFASSFERESRFDETAWRQRMSTARWFAAWADEAAVGVVAELSAAASDEHQLIAMWVAPEHRGMGVSGALVDAVCLSAEAAGAASVALWVVDGNDAARRLYERKGFRETGERMALPSHPDLAEEKLVRRIARP